MKEAMLLFDKSTILAFVGSVGTLVNPLPEQSTYLLPASQIQNVVKLLRNLSFDARFFNPYFSFLSFNYALYKIMDIRNHLVLAWYNLVAMSE